MESVTKTPKNAKKAAANNIADYGKMLPNATEIEESVLGALMIDGTAIDKVIDLLRDNIFYKREHQLIYKAIIALYSNRHPIDIHTVTEQLRKDGTLDDVGGGYNIALLTAKIASSAHIVYHAQILVQKYLARELIGICSDMQAKAYEESTDIEDLLQDTEGRIFDLSQNRIKKGVTQIDPVIEEAIERLKKAAACVDGMSGTPSGFYQLDKITSGWQKSDLIIIAARPAMGKTAFVLSMAKNMAVDKRIPTAIFSLEMSSVQLVNRLIVNVCSITSDKLKKGDLEQHEWKQLDAKLPQLQGAPLYIDDTPSLSILEFQTKARRLKEEHDIQIIIIDYLQLMNASGMRFQSREQEVSTISRSLKGLAKELDIPIIALSQLNRNVENRGSEKSGIEGKKPQLSDLRESGAIEQDADMVCFIHRPDYYKIYEDPVTKKDLRGVAQVIIAKHRNGATGDVNLRFKSEYARFMNEEDLIQPGETLESRINDPMQVPPSNDYTLPPPDDSLPY